MSAKQIFEYHSFQPDSSLNASSVRDISATVLYRTSNKECSSSDGEHEDSEDKPSKLECEWAYLILTHSIVQTLRGASFIILLI